jgi:hypothetical protein
MDSTNAWLRHSRRPYKARLARQLQPPIDRNGLEDKFSPAPVLPSIWRVEGIQGTFYCLTSLAASLMWCDLISRGHEIAYHARTMHFGFKETG